jgi:hypothetical protein
MGHGWVFLRAMKTDVMADAEDAKRDLAWAQQELASLHHALELRRTKLQEKEDALEGKLSLERANVMLCTGKETWTFSCIR